MTYSTCNRCGAQIPETSTFCPRCGAPVQRVAPAAENPKSNVALYAIIGVLLAACLGLAAWIFLFNDKDSKTAETSPAAVSETKAEQIDEVREETTADINEKDLEAQTEAVPEKASDSKGVYMSLWGQIGDSNDVDFEMNGTTGYYSYKRQGQDSGRRTLRLISYDKRTGHCVIEAFSNGKSIGKFDGTFNEVDVEDDEGEHHYGQSYGGKFTSTNGTVLDFSMYVD